MTREEEIEKIAGAFAIDEVKDTCTCNPASKRGLLYVGFVDGARWADSHPHWISVEDELPPLEIVSERWETSDDVLVYTLSCGIFVSRYEFDKRTHEHYWVFSDHDYIVTHWMPLPAPPKKGQ